MLKIQNLSYIIDDKQILKDINLSFQRGKIYVITGPNGSGKSTLIKLIMGIITPNQGYIYLNNEDITNFSITQRAQHGIAYAFQKPVTFKGIKVRRLLDIASGKENSVGEICDYLSAVGLCAKDYIDRPFDDKLSGGEQKRIELAITLARAGEINLFDEPEAGIDIWSFDKLARIFKQMTNSVTIIVSHQKKILEIADEVILIENGDIKAQGSYKKLSRLLEKSECKRLGGER